MNFPLNRREFLALSSASAVATIVNPPNAQAELLQQTSSPSPAIPMTRWQREAQQKLELRSDCEQLTPEALHHRKSAPHYSIGTSQAAGNS